jgi:hypothetical protein
MQIKICEEIYREQKTIRKLTKDFILKEYKKAKMNSNYKEPIEIIYWVHKMNLPTTAEGKGGSIYGTNHSFLELCENLIIGNQNED